MIEVEKNVYTYYTVYNIKGTKILHREDGPAIIYTDGYLEWWLNNKAYSKEEWLGALNEEQKERMLYSEYFIGD
jgi:hypothetical protein